MMWSALCQLLKSGKIAAHESFLLGAAPFLQLAFASDRIGNAIEPLREDEGHGATRLCVALERTSIMLRDPDFELGARRADVVAAVGASENVEVRSFGHPERLVLRDDRFAVSSG
jgi:hypothetical protein